MDWNKIIDLEWSILADGGVSLVCRCWCVQVKLTSYSEERSFIMTYCHSGASSREAPSGLMIISGN